MDGKPLTKKAKKTVAPSRPLSRHSGLAILHHTQSRNRVMTHAPPAMRRMSTKLHTLDLNQASNSTTSSNLIHRYGHHPLRPQGSSESLIMGE
jgi:hypothetical protein